MTSSRDEMCSIKMKQRVLVALSAEEMELILFGCQQAMQYWDDHTLEFLKTDKKLSDDCRVLAKKTQDVHEYMERIYSKRLGMILRSESDR